MHSAKPLCAPLIGMLLCLVPVLAQDTQSQATISQEVTIIIQQQQARFTARKPVEEMRLQVFNQSGEMIFDSGPNAGAEINWSFQNGNGATIKSGLFAYTLSIKEFGNDAARARRGYFIIDRAVDRDSRSDRLWVTSQDADGVGSELTVARGETLTVAGTTSASNRTVERLDRSLKRGGEREVETEAQSSVEASKASAVAAPAGTVGKIAKFITATEVGDSVITELNGNIGIGIGTIAPLGNLHVHGSNGITTTGPGAAFFFRNRETNTNTDYWAWYSQNNIAHFWQSVAGNLISITPSGNVGIGTTEPLGNLHVHGTTGITTSGPGAAFFFRNRETTTNTNYWAWYSQNNIAHFWQSEAGDLINVTPSGSVGIGVSNPTSKLQVEGTGIVETAITSRNERAILALGNTIGPSRYVWTVESGVRGQPGLFGIYNRTVGKSGLEIDGNLLVSVKALELTGGADLSEKFDVLAEKNSANAAASEIQSGMVVSIDPAKPGKLKLSSRAYDRSVVGVISGAGGVKPGMVMGQEGTLADGKYPVALGGRVYCLVDASRGAIKPGDLLTTSSTPGYAMKVTNLAKAQGAIIGKAMTGLKQGKGLVLALVTLQ